MGGHKHGTANIFEAAVALQLTRRSTVVVWHMFFLSFDLQSSLSTVVFKTHTLNILLFLFIVDVETEKQRVAAV